MNILSLSPGRQIRTRRAITPIMVARWTYGHETHIGSGLQAGVVLTVAEVYKAAPVWVKLDTVHDEHLKVSGTELSLNFDLV